MAMRLRNGKKAKSSSNGNRNNSAESSVSELGDGDSDAIVHNDEDDTENEIDDEMVPDDLSEMGQGDASKVVNHSCANCVLSILRYIAWTFVSLALFLMVFLLVLAPLIVKIFPEIPKHIIYLNSFKIPYHVNLSDPASVDLLYARNFYHDVEENITIGVWHVLPKSLEKPGLKDEEFDSLLSSGLPIMLYCHGNTGTRGTGHRVEIYSTLAAQNFHVIALDYRGYGDSTGSPTSENGVMSDVVRLYMWLREKAGPDIPIHIWGHSLGTGIATKATRFLTEQRNEYPRSLILESPFTNLYDAAMEHPFSKMFTWLWWFDHVYMETMHTFGIYLQSDEHICHVEVPVLILHAEDDIIVPHSLGLKLYEASKKRPSFYPPVTFHSFAAERGFTHKWICRAQELPEIIQKFIDGSEKVKKTAP